jgi:hypothetical protein
MVGVDANHRVHAELRSARVRGERNKGPASRCRFVSIGTGRLSHPNGRPRGRSDACNPSDRALCSTQAPLPTGRLRTIASRITVSSSRSPGKFTVARHRLGHATGPSLSIGYGWFLEEPELAVGAAQSVIDQSAGCVSSDGRHGEPLSLAVRPVRLAELLVGSIVQSWRVQSFGDVCLRYEAKTRRWP